MALGQVAFEAFWRRAEQALTWDELLPTSRARWEDAARAVLLGASRLTLDELAALLRQAEAQAVAHERAAARPGIVDSDESGRWAL